LRSGKQAPEIGLPEGWDEKLRGHKEIIKKTRGVRVSDGNTPLLVAACGGIDGAETRECWSVTVLVKQNQVGLCKTKRRGCAKCWLGFVAYSFAMGGEEAVD
jgi:hypothetical protein